MNQSSSKGKSSSALMSTTGRDYAEWFQLLDAWGAPGRGYREIADWLVGQGVSGLLPQKLIVEYQQDRGLRQPGARTGGSFAGGASKTVPFSIDRLYAAFADSELRRSWLPDLELTERTARPGRSISFAAADGFPGERGVRRERGGTGAGGRRTGGVAGRSGGRAGQARLATSAGRSQGVVRGLTPQRTLKFAKLIDVNALRVTLTSPRSTCQIGPSHSTGSEPATVSAR